MTDEEKIKAFPRRTGKTTRLADKLIQDLFENGEITCFEYVPGVDLKVTCNHLFKVVSRRLVSEHPGMKFNFKERDHKITLIK